MAKIDKSDVEHVAKLARIEVSEAEKEEFTQELSGILDYVSELEGTPTGDDIEPIAQISGLENVIREDKIEPSCNRDLMLENAQEKKDGFIKVKKIFE